MPRPSDGHPMLDIVRSGHAWHLVVLEAVSGFHVDGRYPNRYKYTLTVRRRSYYPSCNASQ